MEHIVRCGFSEWNSMYWCSLFSLYYSIYVQLILCNFIKWFSFCNVTSTFALFDLNIKIFIYIYIYKWYIDSDVHTRWKISAICPPLYCSFAQNKHIILKNKKIHQLERIEKCLSCVRRHFSQAPQPSPTGAHRMQTTPLCVSIMAIKY